MSVVEPLDRAMIKHYLEESELKFMHDQDGDFFVMFGATEERPEIQVSLAVERDSKVYAIRVYTTETFPLEEESTLLGLANRWNRENRWPKAVVGPKLDKPTLRVWTEFQLPTRRGVHQELIDDFTWTVIGSSHSFFVWLKEQRALPTVEHLEELFKRAS